MNPNPNRKRTALLIFITAITVLIPIIVSTGRSEGLVTADTEQDYAVFLPAIHVDLPPIVPDTTNVLTEESTENLTISDDGTTYTFAQDTAELDAVAPGEIIVSDVTQAAPDGFLRKVTNVTESNGQVIATTEQATLEEAIEQDAVSLSRRLTPSDIQSGYALPGVTLRAPREPAIDDTFFLEINDVVVYDDDGNLGTTNDQIKANGSIELAPEFDLDFKVKRWKLVHCSVNSWYIIGTGYRRERAKDCES
jgi:hypothetical protein